MSCNLSFPSSHFPCLAHFARSLSCDSVRKGDELKQQGNVAAALKAYNSALVAWVDLPDALVGRGCM